jgi:uncharacterized glyoxalase superfamily protein PhnB
MKKSYEFHGLQPVLPVGDVPSTIAYYVEKLGFDIDFAVGKPPTYVRVSRDDIRLRFVQTSDKTEIAPCGYMYIHLGLDLDNLCNEYRSRGVKMVMEPVSQPWGLREFQIEDCNGYRWRFACEG